MFPIEPSVLGAYVIASTALVISPGPDTMLILRYALTSGPRSGIATVAGVQLGLVVHTTLAVAGISLVIASSPVLFKGIAIAGALYLAWLGIQSFQEAKAFGLDGEGRVSATKACRDGVLCNLLNPKVILIFLALLPNFVDAGRGNVPVQLITLGAVLIVINVVWQGPLPWAADAVRRWLALPAFRKGVSWGSGAVLLAFAALMIYEHVV